MIVPLGRQPQQASKCISDAEDQQTNKVPEFEPIS